MRNFIYQTKINFTRIILRNKKFFFFDLALPVVFYLLYTRILSTGVPSSALKAWKVDYLVSMMVFSCLLGSIITVANTLLEDNTSKFSLLVDISPLSKMRYYASLIVVFFTLNLISIITLILIGIGVNHVDISFNKTILVAICSLLGTTPLIFIGILISLFKTPSTVNMLTSMTVFPMAMLSGLWWPLSLMPNWLQTFGKLLPTYAIANINRAIINNQSLDISNIFNLICWLFILIVTVMLISNSAKYKELEVN